MFQGITKQLTTARKEVIRQQALNNFLDNLIKEQKTTKRNKKKITTKLSKASIPDFDIEKAGAYPGLKALFFGVFGKQENESDDSRQLFLKQYFLRQKLEEYEAELATLIQQIEKEAASKRTISSLDRLTQRIKENTQLKYHHQEVSSMFQYVLKSAEIEGFIWLLEYTIEIGESIQNKLREILRNLKTEANWGSWELFDPTKKSALKIPASGIDKAFSGVAQADALATAFHILSPPFLFNNSLTSHHEKIPGYKEVFIKSILFDWLEGGGTKTTVLKTRQLSSYIHAILHALKETVQKKKTEFSLMEMERENAIKRAEQLVEREKKAEL
ncbi:hypothetical protein [Marinilabilia sp.]|uniref:hypothetical protein n=1 Tax=Marinilabilia sp. TaxID=2021252 RepID=UPI0025C6E3ED|nr:hypothetical protein [Marinilabilia sp.]